MLGAHILELILSSLKLRESAEVTSLNIIATFRPLHIRIQQYVTIDVIYFGEGSEVVTLRYPFTAREIVPCGRPFV